MGLVLDSGVLIAAERDAKPVSEVLTTLEHEHGETEIVLSSITVIELEHGLHRAQSAEQERKPARIPGYCFRGDPGRAVHQGDGAACGEDRRRGAAGRPHGSVAKKMDGSNP